ncbi:hypothetical protein GLAREA_03970 [Glarea lozoyensis ATCC 20868]|uniref:Restriction endonuclease type IV Mrr domain-containing protein n=1 Tax=Glarea lozoyensis (strain ATCC 20868 / MF5171) TaxID=1116229 RepID=S3DXA2_GLAL2|nr:uncharacterized protein GLAREA_03970 [Glarea lozoyensis ATCC 20868]EPE31003.1 hypothetical protein GLAREA_03970 [Glarea lozoyensis ATCC 20868]
MLWTRQFRWLPHLKQPTHSLRRYATDTSPESLIFPEPQSPHHRDLPSFLQYATRVELSPTSNVYVGTHYEYTVQNTLQQMGMSLTRMGGKSDYGIDLLGTWTLPTVNYPLKVLLQCKAVSNKVKPAVVRELEGAFVGAPSGWREDGVLAFLVSSGPATKGVREAMGRSRWPMGYIFCDPEGKMLQMLWNRKAAEEGLEGVVVETRYPLGERESKEVVLTFKGTPLSLPQTSLGTSKPAAKAPTRSVPTTPVVSTTEAIASTIETEKIGNIV